MRRRSGQTLRLSGHVSLHRVDHGEGETQGDSIRFQARSRGLGLRMKDEVRHLRREHGTKQNEQQLNHSSAVNARENKLMEEFDTHSNGHVADLKALRGKLHSAQDTRHKKISKNFSADDTS